jgi:hypothetical protein
VKANRCDEDPFDLCAVEGESCGTAGTCQPALKPEPDRIAGPDRLKGTTDDGIYFEGFDTNRVDDSCENEIPPNCNEGCIDDVSAPDVPGNCSDVNDADGFPNSGDESPRISVSDGSIFELELGQVLERSNDTLGVTVGTAAETVGFETIPGIACTGFAVPPEWPSCIIDPDNTMDWHIHCPRGDCDNDARHNTSTVGAMSKSGNNSLHWGIHLTDGSINGDSTSFRQLAAWRTIPINLTLFPRAGEAELSFWHIASMMDERNADGQFPGHATDYGDVHIQVDTNPDPLVDAWGFWEKLVPFQNVYDHVPFVWSQYGGSYCTLTPSDAGPDPEAGRGRKELTCFPEGVWSACGNPFDQNTALGCDGGPKGSIVQGRLGTSLWVETKFNLANFVGQRFRIRWIAESWDFGGGESYHEYGGTWANRVGDDGWWVDDIQIAGVIESPFLPDADSDLNPTPAQCPTDACDGSQGDGGFAMGIEVTDSTGDGLILAGERITVSAAATVPVGGCLNGGSQFRFFKDESLVQGWSSSPSYADNPVRHTTYRVQARCTADTSACTSSSESTLGGNAIMIHVYRGDADEIVINAAHDPFGGPSGGPETTLSWESIYQPVVPDGYDVVTGAFSAPGDPNHDAVSSATCLGGRVDPEPPPPPGSPVTTTDTGADPAAGEVFFYIAGYAHVTSTCNIATDQICIDDADCPVGETCITRTTTLLGRERIVTPTGAEYPLRPELDPICPP